MAWPAWAAAAVDAGVGIGGQIAANRTNRQLANEQREWMREMFGVESAQAEKFWNMQNDWNLQMWNRNNQYNESQWQRERQWDLDMWHRMNKYNSPQEQMARFKEAGLNPHLIYGKGTPGQASSLSAGQMRATPVDTNQIDSPDVKGYSRAQVDSVTKGINAFRSHVELKNIQAQTDNVEAATDVAKQEKALKFVNTVNRILDANRGHLSFKKEKQLFDVQVDAAKAEARRMAAEADKSESQSEIITATKKDQIDKAAAELESIRRSNKKLKFETRIKKWESQLRSKYNLTEKDWLIVRALVMGLDSIQFDPELNKDRNKNFRSIPR